MHSTLQDLRLLYLAKHLEETFEGLERAFQRHLPEGPVRDALQPLFVDGPNHKRLREALDRLNRQAKTLEASLEVSDLLQAILDCERMAQGFYLGRLDDLSDAELVQIFRGLAAEEGTHIQAVQEAQRLHGMGLG